MKPINAPREYSTVDETRLEAFVASQAVALAAEITNRIADVDAEEADRIAADNALAASVALQLVALAETIRFREQNFTADASIDVNSGSFILVTIDNTGRDCTVNIGSSSDLSGGCIAVVVLAYSPNVCAVTDGTTTVNFTAAGQIAMFISAQLSGVWVQFL